LSELEQIETIYTNSQRTGFESNQKSNLPSPAALSASNDACFAREISFDVGWLGLWPFDLQLVLRPLLLPSPFWL
jgi:hypothetical protein